MHHRPIYMVNYIIIISLCIKHQSSGQQPRQPNARRAARPETWLIATEDSYLRIGRIARLNVQHLGRVTEQMKSVTFSFSINGSVGHHVCWVWQHFSFSKERERQERDLRGKAIDMRTASRIGRSGVVTGVQYSEHIRLRFVTTIRNSRPHLSCNYDNNEDGFLVSMTTEQNSFIQSLTPKITKSTNNVKPSLFMSGHVYVRSGLCMWGKYMQVRSIYLCQIETINLCWVKSFYVRSNPFVS